MGQSPYAVISLLLLIVATAAAQNRELKQANAPAVAPRAQTGVRTPPLQPQNFKLVRGAPVNTENGAYIGCFNVTKLIGIDWGSQHQPEKITQCRKYCEDRWYAFNIIKAWGACLCTMEIPAAAARLQDSVCDSKSSSNAVAVFYNDYNANARACRIVETEMYGFLWAYNQDKTSFANGVMTIQMDGDSGARLYYPLALQYGLVEVSAKVSGASGVVSAFYLRSDTMQETTDFSEIDFEFLNGNPGVPGSLWTNSFKGGTSFGERMIPPGSYKSTLGTKCAVTECWYNFKINWQPNQVSWIVNNRVLRRNYYDQKVEWCDMLGKCTTKAFRPPTLPSFPTFSMWHDVDNGGSFGGQLGPGSPFTSSFKGLRMVACDKPLTAYNGPSWTFGGTAPPPTPTPP
eukprot:jgi/Sobl393_1/9173/SZX67086.1